MIIINEKFLKVLSNISVFMCVLASLVIMSGGNATIIFIIACGIGLIANFLLGIWQGSLLNLIFLIMNISLL